MMATISRGGRGLSLPWRMTPGPGDELNADASLHLWRWEWRNWESFAIMAQFAMGPFVMGQMRRGPDKVRAVPVLLGS